MTFQELKDILTKPVGAPKASLAGKSPATVPTKGVKALTDVVGVELNSGDSRGCPAVRLVHRKGEWIVKAIGFVPPPTRPMPIDWKGLNDQPTWSLPSAFAAPHAAFAVNSADQVTRQTTIDSLSDASGKSVEVGQPISRDGLRYVIEPLGDSSFALQAGLPEFQVLWLSRLLPEGKRPTACSIQTVPAAMLSVLVEQPEYTAANGNAAALFVSQDTVYFAGYRDWQLILFREFQGVGGCKKVQEALKTGFGMDAKMMDQVLDDTLIDPTPILTPILTPIFRQLELSLDYVRGRLGVALEKVFLMGLTSGAQHWSRLAEAQLKIKFIAPALFTGLSVPFGSENDAMLKRDHQFLAAYGAARAAMEVGS